MGIKKFLLFHLSVLSDFPTHSYKDVTFYVIITVSVFGKAQQVPETAGCLRFSQNIPFLYFVETTFSCGSMCI